MTIDKINSKETNLFVKFVTECIIHSVDQVDQHNEYKNQMPVIVVGGLEENYLKWIERSVYVSKYFEQLVFLINYNY